jgi:hypothetical protein
VHKVGKEYVPWPTSSQKEEDDHYFPSLSLFLACCLKLRKFNRVYIYIIYIIPPKRIENEKLAIYTIVGAN